MTRTVSIRNAHPRLRLDRRVITGVIAVLDTHAAKFRAGCPPGELSLAFLTDAALAGIHGAFMGDPTTTDVITFVGNPALGLAGEICVSADTAARYAVSPPAGGPAPARRQAPAFAEKFSAELTLYLVHGWLHLAGYDDGQPAKKRRMRAAEARAMKLLRAAQAVPEFRMVRP